MGAIRRNFGVVTALSRPEPPERGELSRCMNAACCKTNHDLVDGLGRGWRIGGQVLWEPGKAKWGVNAFCTAPIPGKSCELSAPSLPPNTPPYASKPFARSLQDYPRLARIRVLTNFSNRRLERPRILHTRRSDFRELYADRLQRITYWLRKINPNPIS